MQRKGGKILVLDPRLLGNLIVREDLILAANIVQHEVYKFKYKKKLSYKENQMIILTEDNKIMIKRLRM